MLLASGCAWSTVLEEPALRSTQQEPISDNEPCTVGVSTDGSVPDFKGRAGFTQDIYSSPHLGGGSCLDENSDRCRALNVLKSRPPKREPLHQLFSVILINWEKPSKRGEADVSTKPVACWGQSDRNPNLMRTQKSPEVMHLDGTLSTKPALSTNTLIAHWTWLQKLLWYFPVGLHETACVQCTEVTSLHGSSVNWLSSGNIFQVKAKLISALVCLSSSSCLRITMISELFPCRKALHFVIVQSTFEYLKQPKCSSALCFLIFQ